MEKPKTLNEIEDATKIDKVRKIVAKWDKHIRPGSEWHAQECCVDELVEELKAALR